MKKENILFEMIQDFFVSVVLTTTAQLLSGTGIGISLTGNILFAWIINMIIGFSGIGIKMAKLFLNRCGNKIRFFLELLIIVIVNVVGISLCSMIKDMGLSVMMLKNWIHLLIPLIMVGYAAALLFFPISKKAVNCIVKYYFKDTNEK